MTEAGNKLVLLPSVGELHVLADVRSSQCFSFHYRMRIMSFREMPHYIHDQSPIQALICYSKTC